MTSFAKTKIKALKEFPQTYDLSRSFFNARISQDTNFPEKIWNCFREKIQKKFRKNMERKNTQVLLTYKDSIND